MNSVEAGREMTVMKCNCGCGKETKMVAKTGKGYRKGEYLKFIHGHNGKGAGNGMWKGPLASYSAFHYRVATVRGKADRCVLCGGGERFSWANRTGNYADVNDYSPLCGTCHKKYDDARRGRKRVCKWGHAMTTLNTHIYGDGTRDCKACMHDRAVARWQKIKANRRQDDAEGV
jgi:hypothetical protein